MTKRLEVYECQICGNLVEVLRAGGGQLVCCGQNMTLLEENTVDASKEKHVPVVEKTAEGVKVTVGSTQHPMQDDHYIEWIQIIVGEQSQRLFLQPGQPPQAVFKVAADADVVAREYCNLHGLWKS